MNQQNDKYVLFYAQHLSSLYQFITLKYTQYKSSKIILFVNKESFSRLSISKNMIENKIFEKIISFNEPFIKNDTNQENGIRIINNFYDNIFTKNNINLENISEIVTACDVQNYLFIYCSLKNKYPNMLELYKNQFEAEWRKNADQIYGNGAHWIESINNAYGALTGVNSNTKKRFLCKGSNIKYFNKDIIIDFENEFFNLPTPFKQILCKTLSLDDKNLNDCNILLTNSIGYSKPKSNLDIPVHYLPYLLILDYYFDDKPIYFKDHPQTPNSYINKELKHFLNIIDSEIPIEFLGLTNNFHVNKLISINSTGNAKISKFISDDVKLGDNYFQNWFYIHKAYLTFLIDDYVNKSTDYHVYEINKEFISKFKENVFSPFKLDQPKGINTKILKGNIFTIIGNVQKEESKNIEFSLLNADLKTKVVFWDLDYKNIISFENMQLLDYIVPITIHKEKLREDTLSDTNDETIYFFCKDENIRNKIKNFKFEKELKHTGIKIYSNTSQDINNALINQNMKINILTEKIKDIK